MKMTVKKVKKILNEVPDYEINPGEHAYYGDYEEKVLRVFVISKKESKLSKTIPCYTIFSKELNKLMYIEVCPLFKTEKEAEQYRQAKAFIKEHWEELKNGTIS